MAGHQAKVRAGRIGGRISGRRAVESGQLDAIRNLPQTKAAQKAIGRRNAESGHLARIRALPKTKAAQREAGRKSAESGQLTDARRIMLERGRNGTTSLQLELNRILDSMGIAYVKNYPIGPYHLDAGVPDRKIDIEADGPLHELLENRERDHRRDEYLRLQGWTVVRIGWREFEDDALVRSLIVGAIRP